MGKAKKARNRRRKGGTSPGNKRATSSPSDLVKQLNNADPDERAAACLLLANSFGDHGSIKSERAASARLASLVSNGVFRAMLPRVCDSDLRVQLHACGALRNISVVGGYTACETMVQKDTMTSLLAAIERLVVTSLSAVADGNVVEANSLDDARQALLQALELACNLTEAAESVASELGRSERSVGSIARCLDPDPANATICLAAAKLLNIASDCNAELASSFLAVPPLCTHLCAAAGAEAMSLGARLHTCGALVSLAHENEGLAEYGLTARQCLLNTLTKANLLVFIAPEESSSSSADVVASDALSDTERQENISVGEKHVCNIWTERLVLQCLGLEVLANACSSPDQSDESKNSASRVVHTQFLDLICSSNVFPSVLEMMCRAATAIKALYHLLLETAIEEGGQLVVMSEIGRLCQRIAGSLDNLVQELPAKELKLQCAAVNLWSKICDACDLLLEAGRAAGLDANNDVIEAAVAVTAVMFSLLRRSCAGELEMEVNDSHVAALAVLLRTGQVAQLRANSAAMLGTLGRIPHGTAVNSVLGEALLSGLSDSEPEVLSECLRGLFDVYRDTTHDAVLSQLDGLNVMRDSLPALVSKVSAMEQGGDVWGSVDEGEEDPAAELRECVEVLARFLDFKSSA